MKRHRSSPSRKRVGSSNKNKASESRFRPLTCEKETALIADYLASNLSPADFASFENHLEGCPDCKAFLQTYKKTIEITPRTSSQYQCPTGPGKYRISW